MVLSFFLQSLFGNNFFMMHNFNIISNYLSIERGTNMHLMIIITPPLLKNILLKCKSISIRYNLHGALHLTVFFLFIGKIKLDFHYNNVVWK